MIPRWRKVLDWVLGTTLIAIGVVMGFIPVLQGWVFVLAGLAVLSSHSAFARRLYEQAKAAGRRVKERVTKPQDGGAP